MNKISAGEYSNLMRGTNRLYSAESYAIFDKDYDKTFKADKSSSKGGKNIE